MVIAKLNPRERMHDFRPLVRVEMRGAIYQEEVNQLMLKENSFVDLQFTSSRVVLGSTVMQSIPPVHVTNPWIIRLDDFEN